MNNEQLSMNNYQLCLVPWHI